MMNVVEQAELRIVGRALGFEARHPVRLLVLLDAPLVPIEHDRPHLPAVPRRVRDRLGSEADALPLRP